MTLCLMTFVSCGGSGDWSSLSSFASSLSTATFLVTCKLTTWLSSVGCLVNHDGSRCSLGIIHPVQWSSFYPITGSMLVVTKILLTPPQEDCSHWSCWSMSCGGIVLTGTTGVNLTGLQNLTFCLSRRRRRPYLCTLLSRHNLSFHL